MRRLFDRHRQTGEACLRAARSCSAAKRDAASSQRPAVGPMSGIGAAAVALSLSVSGAAAQTQVGVSAAVNPSASFQRPSGTRTITIGDNVLFQDRIVTSEDALVQVLFVDGSTFTVGPNARVVIDEFVFDPATGSGELVANVTQGALRFVGGSLSKRGGQVRFRTPVGTLGVRGGIVNIDLDPSCNGDEACPSATASLVFGDELIVEDGGKRQRIYDAGYSFVFGEQGGTRVVPTRTLDQSTLQSRLAGTPSGDGGSDNKPTDTNVTESGLPQINSALLPRVVLPRPKPILVSSQFAPSDEQPGTEDVNTAVALTITEGADNDFIDTVVQRELDNDDDDNDPGDDVTLESFARAVTTPPQYLTRDGNLVSSPVSLGIVVDSGVAVEAEFVTDEAGNVIALVANGETLPFPDAQTQTDLPTFTTDLVPGEVRGTVIRGQENFALYYFQPDTENGAQQQILYFAAGELTPADALLPTVPVGEATVRSYTLSSDLQRDNRGLASEMLLLNPLVVEAFGGALADAVETEFLLAERGVDRDFAQTMYAGLLISGEGSEQASAVTLDVGSFVRSGDDAISVIGRRRGSYRLTAGDAAVPLSGPTGSLEAEGGGGLLGSEGQNFVYTTGPAAARPENSPTDVFFDRQTATNGLLTDPGELYSGMTVAADLASETPVGDLDRRSGIFSGVAAGIVTPDGSDGAVFRSTAVGDMVIAFDPNRSTVGGFIDTADVEDADTIVNRYRFAFGFDVTGQDDTAQSRGTFIDNDNFAAIETGAEDGITSPRSSVALDSGPIEQLAAGEPVQTYMISADAVPQDELFAASGVTPCVCEFLEWGWWGTDVAIDDGDGGLRRDTVHLGTWAAGDITAEVDMPTTGSGTYSGHAVGNVVSQTNGATSQYVAAGDLDVRFDFGARTGDIAISNFDGRNFSGSIASDGSVSRGNQFTGNLSGSGLSGGTVGAFVNGPNGAADGVLGNFNVGGAGYSATGVYVGERNQR